MSGHFWKLSSATLLEVELRKICTTPAGEIDLEVKIVMTVSGRFWTFQVVFAWQAQGFRQVAKYVAGAGVREGCKNVGRRGGFEEGLKRCVSRGRRNDILRFVMSMFEASDAESVEVLQISCHGSVFAVIISRGSYRTSYASAQLFRGRRSTFEACT